MSYPLEKELVLNASFLIRLMNKHIFFLLKNIEIFQFLVLSFLSSLLILYTSFGGMPFS